MSRERPLVETTCCVCKRHVTLRRLRGPWRGLVQVQNPADREFHKPVLQLPEKAGRYTLEGFRCDDCGPVVRR